MDGLYVNLPYINEDFEICSSGMLFIPAIKAKIMLAGRMFGINLPYEGFYQNTEGQCGQSQFILSLLSNHVSYCISFLGNFGYSRHCACLSCSF